MKNVTCSLATLAMICAAGAAIGQTLPPVNGKLKPEYGPILWYNQTPTSYGDSTTEYAPAPACDCLLIGNGIQIALNNSNRAGPPANNALLTPDQVALAAAVTTGFEIAIPLSAIGNPSGSVKVAGFVTQGDLSHSSNQFIGGHGANAVLDAYPDVRVINFATTTGNQYVTISVDPAGTAPTIDGTLDANYGSALFVQDTGSNYGKAAGTPADLFQASGGSEIDAVYGKIIGGTLYLFIAGNLESNFNKLELWFDNGGPGQNIVTSTNCLPQAPRPTLFDSPNRSGAAAGLPGLTFDTGFNASYWMDLTVGGTPRTMYPDFAKLGGPDVGGAGGWARQLTLINTGTDAAPVFAVPGQSIANGNVMTASAATCPTVVVSPPPGPADYAAGSEIDGLYAMVCGGNADPTKNYLYVLVTGNLQNSTNRLDLFIDCGTTNGGTPDAPINSAGQNVILGTNPRVDNGALSAKYGTDATTPATRPGLKFSSGFFADYWISYRQAGAPNVVVDGWAAMMKTGGALYLNGSGTPPKLLEYASFKGGQKSTNNPLNFDGTACPRFNDASVTAACGPGAGADGCNPNGVGTFWNPMPIFGIDIQGDAFQSANTISCIVSEPFSSFAPRLISNNVYDPLGKNSGDTNWATASLLQITVDNSNRGGVTGTADANAAQSGVRSRTVTTGTEYSIRLDELGWDGTSPIKITGWISSDGHDSISNQVIGGQLPDGQGNLADSGAATPVYPNALDFTSTALTTGTGAQPPYYVTFNITATDCTTAAVNKACCFVSNTICSVMSNAQCVQAGGTPNAASTCTGTPCAPAQVVCCRGAACALVAAGSCPANGTIGNSVGSSVATGAACGTGATFTGCCYADFDKINGVQIDDIFAYLNAWFAKSVYADISTNGANLPDIDDIFAYLNSWFSKCVP